MRLKINDFRRTTRPILRTLSITFLLKQDTRKWNAIALLSCLPRASTPEMLSRTLKELTSVGSLMKTTQSVRIMKHELQNKMVKKVER